MFLPSLYQVSSNILQHLILPFSCLQFLIVPCRMQNKGPSQTGPRLPSCGISTHYPRPGQIEPLCSILPPSLCLVSCLECHLRLCACLGLPVCSCTSHPRSPFLRAARTTVVSLVPWSRPYPLSPLPEASYYSKAGALEAVSPRKLRCKEDPWCLWNFPESPRCVPLSSTLSS